MVSLTETTETFLTKSRLFSETGIRGSHSTTAVYDDPRECLARSVAELSPAPPRKLSVGLARSGPLVCHDAQAVQPRSLLLPAPPAAAAPGGGAGGRWAWPSTTAQRDRVSGSSTSSVATLRRGLDVRSLRLEIGLCHRLTALRRHPAAVTALTNQPICLEVPKRILDGQ